MHGVDSTDHKLHSIGAKKQWYVVCGAGENGGRADTRWVTLSDEDGVGVAAVTLCEPLQMNATRWEDLHSG